jgi:hypothetical protein
MPYTTSEFYAGLDLGQSVDYTALAVVERITLHYYRSEWAAHGGPPKAAPPSYELRHLERLPLGVSYPAQVKHVASLLERPPLKGSGVQLALDFTGVGRPIYDLFLAAKLGCSLIPVTITGSDNVTREGSHYRVPKRDLIAVVNMLLQSDRLKIAASLPAAAILKREMENFRMKISVTGHDSYGNWREGQHDDLVLATSLSVWWAEEKSRHTFKMGTFSGG